MYLAAATQNSTATLIAKWIRENMAGYGAIATEVDQAGVPDAAVVAIAKNGKTTCTAKVAVHRGYIAYTSARGAHVSYSINPDDAGRIVGSLLSLEED